MPWLKCRICNSDFYAKPRHIRIGWGKYCSQTCAYKGMMTGKLVECGTCGKNIYRAKKELRVSRSQRYFCNKSCFAVWKNKNVLVGDKHVNWKYGESIYRNILIKSGVPFVCAGCKIDNLKVLVAHHIDRDRKNNKVNNLEWLCRNCHYLEHGGKTL